MKSIVIKKKDISIVLLLLVPCLTFILEEMVSNYMVATGMMILLLCGSLLFVGRLDKRSIMYSNIWILYAAAVVLSVLQRNISRTVVLDVTIILLVVLSIIISQGKVIDYIVGCKMLCVFGVINCAGVLLQFLLREDFNNSFLKLFTDAWNEYALKYYNMGYFTGFQAVPGDAAGAIVFAIGIILSYYFLRRNYRNRKNTIAILTVVAILTFTLLLTGKKGVLASGVLAIIIVYLMLTAQNRQWIRIAVMAAAVIIGGIIFKDIVMKYADNPVFYRLATFFEQLSSGEHNRATSGRITLYMYALANWKRHSLLGIGWRKFREYTVALYGYGEMHDVNLDYLQFLCECGIVGFVLIMIPVIITLRRAIIIMRSVFERNLNLKEQWVILVSGFIQFYTLIYACIEIPFHDRVFFVTYAFSCIVVNNAYRELKTDTITGRGYEN